MPALVIPTSLTRPVPASQARSQAQAIIDTNRERVEALNDSARRELTRVLVRAQAQIAEQLGAEVARRGDGTWTAQDAESTLVLVQQALGGIAPRFRGLLADNADRCRARGVKDTAGLLSHFERRAGGGQVEGGVIRPLAIREALALRHPLLERHATSVDRYGAHMIGVIRRELQAGIIRGATFGEMTDRLVGKRGPRGVVSMAARVSASGQVVRTSEERIGEGLFVRYRGWAERIVRTEGMYAYATGVDEEIVAQRARFPDLQRKLIETFDRRTAQDSYAAHGQVRAPGEFFRDGKGREYERPPGRPNDRAVLIPWREAWAEPTKPAPVALAPPAPPAVVAPVAPVPAAPPAPLPPPVAPAPVVPQLGVHFTRLTSTVAPAELAHILGAIGDAGLAEFLTRHPVEDLQIRRGRLNNKVGLHGWYMRGTRELHVTTARAPSSWNKPLVPGVSTHVSHTGATPLDAARRTLTHELGHHVHLTAGPAVDAIVRDAYRRGVPVTHYGSLKRTEHFAESFAAYVYERETLRRADPVGFAMVETVLRAQGIIR